MSTKGQYVIDDLGQHGMIESEETDLEGYHTVYYGVVDKRPVRLLKHFSVLTAVETPLNGRVNGEMPEEEFKKEDEDA